MTVRHLAVVAALGALAVSCESREERQKRAWRAEVDDTFCELGSFGLDVMAREPPAQFEGKALTRAELSTLANIIDLAKLQGREDACVRHRERVRRSVK